MPEGVIAFGIASATTTVMDFAVPLRVCADGFWHDVNAETTMSTAIANTNAFATLPCFFIFVLL